MSAKFFSGRLSMLSLVLAAVCLAAILGGTASAALLVYDPFSIGAGPGDYLVGDENAGTDLLGGQNPVSSPTAFYAGGWIQAGGDSQAVRQPGGPGLGSVPIMNYPLFPREGGLVTDRVQFGCCSFGRTGRQLATALGPGRNASTIYQSFLVDFGNQGTDNPADYGKRGVEWWNGYDGDSPDGELAVDLFLNSFSGTNDLTLAVTTPTGTTSAQLNGGGLNLANLAGVHLVVMKFEFNPGLTDPNASAVDPSDDDTVTVFLDPTDSIESNWTPAAVVSAASSDLVITHHGATGNFTFSGGGHVPARFDEVRWGDTFLDVTPFTPEPTSLTLAGLSLAGILLSRRRM